MRPPPKSSPRIPDLPRIGCWHAVGALMTVHPLMSLGDAMDVAEKFQEHLRLNGASVTLPGLHTEWQRWLKDTHPKLHVTLWDVVDQYQQQQQHQHQHQSPEIFTQKKRASA